MINSPSSPTDPLNTVPSDRLWLRSELMGTQVITRDTGRRLGLVGEVIVDIDRREVVALGLRDNPLTRFLPGLPRWMPLDRIRQVGDVILVDSVDSLSEAFTPERYSKVINCEVITESGQQLGRVLGFSFDIETGELTTLVMGALGVPVLGEGLLSTWEIPVEEIVSSGTDRIIVYEGAEEKLKQLNSGVLEKLGIGGSSWEEQERDRYRVNLVPVENQLSSGETFDREESIQDESYSEELEEEELEEEIEYVEVESNQQSIKQQKRYLDEPATTTNSRSMRNSTYRDDQITSSLDDQYDLPQDSSSFKNVNQSKPASRRPVQEDLNPLDVEPVDKKANVGDQKNPPFPPLEGNELDDPW